MSKDQPLEQACSSWRTPASVLQSCRLRGQSRWRLMHECPHPNSPSLIETQSELADRRKTAARRRHFYIQTLTPSWLPFPPTDLRLCYKAADDSAAAAKCLAVNGDFNFYFSLSWGGSPKSQPCFLFWGSGQMF